MGYVAVRSGSLVVSIPRWQTFGSVCLDRSSCFGRDASERSVSEARQSRRGGETTVSPITPFRTVRRPHRLREVSET